MTRNRTTTSTRSDVELQRRDGVPTAVISVETVEETYNGRGYAGQAVTKRQVLVVPVSALGALVESITGGLAYDLTAEDAHDLTVDAQPRIGLYEPHPINGKWQKVAEFYTLKEARVYSAAFKGQGYTLRHLDEAESDDPYKLATSVIETL